MTRRDDRSPSAAVPPEAGDGESRDATEGLAARVAKRAAERFADRPLHELLAHALSGSDLTTLLLHAFRHRARARRFADVRDHAARTPLLQASSADARRMHAFDAVAFECSSAFEALDLAPVMPLGTSACVGIDPNNVLGALRFTEVAADPTTAMALHAVEARCRGRAEAPLRYAASQRVARLQPVDQPGFSPHFRLFALGTAARTAADRNGDRVDAEALAEHLDVWMRIVAALPAAGFAIAGTRVVLSDTRLVRACFAARGLDAAALGRGARAHRPEAGESLIAASGVELPRSVEDPVAAVMALGLGDTERGWARTLVDFLATPLRARHPSLDVRFDLARLEGIHYYEGATIRFFIRRPDGFEVAIGDGGALPWTRELLSDRRERWVTSAAGAELVVKLFDDSGLRASGGAA